MASTEFPASSSPQSAATKTDSVPLSSSDAGPISSQAKVAPFNPPLPSEPAPSTNPPLPNEAPPLPNEAPPSQDDGWDAIWDNNAATFYFYNRFTQKTQWDNPRVPDPAQVNPSLPSTSQAGVSSSQSVPGVDPTETTATSAADRPRYNPAIHGSYDPNADYAKADAEEAAERERQADVQAAIAAGADPTAAYAATGRFNRFTGKWQRADLNPENFNDDQKSLRQQRAFFDVEAAANSHDGKSLKAERAGKKLSKQEVKAFKDKRKAKKEEKRRAWLRD